MGSKSMWIQPALATSTNHCPLTITAASSCQPPTTQLEESGNNRVRSQSSTCHLESPICLQVSAILPPIPSAPAAWNLLPFLPETFSSQGLSPSRSLHGSTFRVGLGSSSLDGYDSWRSLAYVTPVSWLTQVGWPQWILRPSHHLLGLCPQKGILMIPAPQPWDGRPRASCLPGNAQLCQLYVKPEPLIAPKQL